MKTILLTLRSRVHLYWQMTKSLQTGLLLVTGLAGYMSARCPVLNWTTVLQLAASLFLAISGSTVLNMWYDRDIDARMARTCLRPLPSQKISPREALILGWIMSFLGLAWAYALDALYAAIVFAGFFFDVVIYTLWLKRRTAWSILWGGISGGMPILAGRVLGVGAIDWIGLTLSLAVLFWIPTHIMTFNMRFFEDYQRAGIPTFPQVYGFKVTRIAIALSSVLASLSMGIAFIGVGMTWGYLRLMAVFSFGLLLLVGYSLKHPSERMNFGLFKYASLFMLSSMLLLIFAAGSV